jgi:hypothetical protein
MKCEQVNIWEEIVMAYLKVSSWYLPARAEKTQEKNQHRRLKAEIRAGYFPKTSLNYHRYTNLLVNMTSSERCVERLAPLIPAREVPG